jgi:hypothetical protein
MAITVRQHSGDRAAQSGENQHGGTEQSRLALAHPPQRYQRRERQRVRLGIHRVETPAADGRRFRSDEDDQ